MVGRAGEREGLVGCWRRVTQGETHFALILGEPGIGKSRLAEDLFQFCSTFQGAAAVRARCYFAQGQLAYGPVAEWLRGGPMPFVRTQLPRPQLAELARALPEILMETPDIGAPQPLTESWQRRHFYEALSGAFHHGPKPLLLLIPDDLQWCDQRFFRMAAFLFPAPRAVPHLGAAIRCAPEETGRDHRSTGLISELRQSGQLSAFPMAPLTVEETAALASVGLHHPRVRSCIPERPLSRHQREPAPSWWRACEPPSKINPPKVLRRRACRL